ncbi:MAG: DEAD/DEAH box helicase [Bdellovibrionales bacterium]
MKFSELDLHPLLQKNLEKVNFVECTPIQADAIPHVLHGRDIAGLAQTGTGKTAAFLLPLIDRVLRGRDRPSAVITSENPTLPPEKLSEEAEAAQPEKIAPGEVLEAPPGEEAQAATPEELHLRYFPDWRRRQYVLILVPTRELAEQVYENAQTFLEGTGLKAISVMGGTTYDKQKAGFKEGVEFVIATPGRLLDLYKDNVADLRQVRAVVFDEADRMFDMGFKDDMKFILRRLPRERQFLVFSATLNFEVLNTAYEFGAYPVEINVSKDQPKAENVTDELLHVGHDEKPKFLLSFIKKKTPRQAIIFSNFKHNVERIARFLTDNGVPAVGISSLLTQAQRNRVMAQFKADNDQNILVATDLAARGLDILGVDMVINFELPDDPENYVHRIGRTGRAGHKGVAVSLTSDRDVDALARIEDYLGHKVPIGWLDDNDLVKEMKPFPSDRERSRSGPREGGRFNDRGGGRGGGRDRDRGPRRDRSGGGGQNQGGGSRRPHGEGQHRQEHRGAGRDRDRDPQRRDPQRPHVDRPPRDRNPQQAEGPGGGEPRRRHRGGRGRGGRDRDRDPRDKQNGQPRGPRDQQRQGQGPSRSGGRYGGGVHRPQGAMAAKGASQAGIGQKVSGFFKKLFGGKSN